MKNKEIKGEKIFLLDLQKIRLITATWYLVHPALSVLALEYLVTSHQSV